MASIVRGLLEQAFAPNQGVLEILRPQRPTPAQARKLRFLLRRFVRRKPFQVSRIVIPDVADISSPTNVYAQRFDRA